MECRLTRIASHPEHGTFGTLKVDGKPICLTLEPYHRSNARSISCIPAGPYEAEVQFSEKYKNVWTITEVEGRSYIRIHKGNFDDDTAGCIILGEEFGVVDDKWAVLSSGRAIEEFHKLCRTILGSKMLFTIVEKY